MKVDSITLEELFVAVKALKSNRTPDIDQIHAEFQKSILQPSSPATKWALEFVNLCWSKKSIPESWHQARVAMIFKKGDPSEADNYRPISLLSIGFKLFAIIMLNRLRQAGAEDRLWASQFGFRRGRGTYDALFMARRLIEDTWSKKNGSATLLALDWAKAFGSISPAALQLALERFGCPPAFIQMIASIYSDRKFNVSDSGQTSSLHDQCFGICQGCPLSPFLFVMMMMTILLHDAKDRL